MSLLVQGSAQGAKSGHIPVLVCHATDSLPNSYVIEYPDADSTGLIGPNGHQAHRDHPNKVWKKSGWWNGKYYTAGSPKPDYIHSYTDHQGVFHLEDGDVTPAFCQAVQVPTLPASPSVTFTPPDCSTPTASWSGANVVGVDWYKVTSGDTSQGSTLVVTAKAATGYAFLVNGKWVSTKTFTYEVPTVDPENCPTEGNTMVTPLVSFLDPSCNNKDGSAVNPGGQGYLYASTVDANNPITVNGVTYTITGALGSGEDVTVTAAAAQGFEFTAGSTTVWPHTFASFTCDIVKPPTKPHVVKPPTKPHVVKPPTKPHVVVPPPVVPSVVHSGLASVSGTSDTGAAMRALGVWLTGAGAVVLLGSVGLLRRARIDES